MARIARIVIPHQPHHIIQRGNRSQQVFFSDQDKRAYLEILKIHIARTGISIWAYCLMDNHVHLLVVPHNEDSLARGIGEAHRMYTRMINFRNGWRGYLWQGRFSSYPLNQKHLYAVMRYIENNPVKAGLVTKAEDYQWSSARAHILKRNNDMLSNNFMTAEIKNWGEYLREGNTESENKKIIYHLNTGRPFGDERYLIKLEKLTNKIIRKQKPGPKIK